MKYNNMLPDVRRGLDSAAMASRVIWEGGTSKKCPVRLSTSGAGKELPDTASGAQLRPARVRERATPCFRVVLRTPMTSSRTAFPHCTRWKKQRYDLLAFCNRNYHTVLNNGSMIWACACGDVSVV